MATLTSPMAFMKTPAMRTIIQALEARLTAGTSSVRRRYIENPLAAWTAWPASWQATATEATDAPEKFADERCRHPSAGLKLSVSSPPMRSMPMSPAPPSSSILRATSAPDPGTDARTPDHFRYVLFM